MSADQALDNIETVFHSWVFEPKFLFYAFNCLREKGICVCIYMYMQNAGLQQHGTIACPKARIPQDTPAGSSKRRGKPIQQAISRMAMV